MSDNKLKPIEGEVVEETPRQARDENPKGVFIGTLNIMTEPGRNYITEPLGKLYRSRYHGKYKRPRHVFAFDIGLVALGAAIATVAIYFSFFFKPFDPIQISFSALPKNPAAGGEVILNYAVANLSADSLNEATVTFKLPSGIKFKRSSLAYQRDRNAVNLDTIDARSDVAERLVGELSGNPGKELKAIATLTYKNRSGATVSRSESATVKIAKSTVGASFSLPDNIFIGQPVSGTIDYWNRGNATAENVVLTPSWPDDFSLVSSQPPLKSGRWEIGALAPGSAGKISWTGIIGAGMGETDFRVETGLKSGNDILVQSENLKTVVLSDPQISITIDGASGAALGQTISLTASYKNIGDHTLSGASLTIVADDGLVIVGENGKSGINIGPGESGSWQFKVKLDDSLPEAVKEATNPQIKVRAALSGKLDDRETISIHSLAFAIKIASSLSLNSIARYWSESDDQLGRGPLPPEVGKTTRYWIFWNAKNTSGAVNSVRVSGKLPMNASFTGKASVPFGDAPIYDPATRILTWNAGNLPAWPGVAAPAIGIAFEIALIPTLDQVGAYPLLITNQKIIGTDAVTGLALSGTASDLTAHLTADPKAADTGTVK